MKKFSLSILVVFIAHFAFSQSYLYHIPYAEKGQYGYADTLGKVLLTPQYKSVTFFEANGSAIVGNTTNNQELFGVINAEFKLVLPIKFSAITFNGNLITAETINQENTTKGLYNNLGNEILQMKYSGISITQNFITAYNGRIKALYRYNTQTKQGEKLYKETTENIYLHKDNNNRVTHFSVINNKDVKVYYDTLGNVIANLEKIKASAKEKTKIIAENTPTKEHFVYTKNKMKGFITYQINNKLKRDSFAPVYQNLKSVRLNHSEILLAKQKGKWGAIDNNNKIIVPFKYDSISCFRTCQSDDAKDGIDFFVKEDNKWGMINSKQASKYILLNIYEDILEFECPFYSIKFNENYGFVQIINHQKANILQPKYRTILGYKVLPNNYTLIQVELANRNEVWVNWTGKLFGN